MGLKIDGIAASQAIDTSGESIIIESLDISSLQEGTAELIYEHKSPKDAGASPLDILGAITFAKKIYSLSDCDNDRERMYWKQIELPFLYIQAELFDHHPGSEALASIIRWYHKNKLPILMRYSIDGNTLERDKDNPNILKACIARSVAITVRPCNQSCVSGVLEDDLEASQEGETTEVKKGDGSYMHRLPGTACWVMPEEIKSDPISLIKGEQDFLRDSEDLVKTMTAGFGGGTAPSNLTQGAAQQKEDFATRKKAVRRLQASCRDWNGKGSLKEHLEKTLTDVHPGFIEKFCEALDSFHLKKAADLNDLLEKAIAGDLMATQAGVKPPSATATPDTTATVAGVKPPTANDATMAGVKPPSQTGMGMTTPVGKPVSGNITGAPKKDRSAQIAAINADAARSNPEAAKLQAMPPAPPAPAGTTGAPKSTMKSPAIRHAQMASINAEIRANNPQAAYMQGMGKSEGPLTIGGQATDPNPNIAGAVFSGGALSTPRGTFKFTMPQASDHKLLARVNAGRALAVKAPSDALRLTALMIGTGAADHELGPMFEGLRGIGVDQVHHKLDSMGIDPKSARLTAALLGSNHVLVPGDECMGSMFGLGDQDTEAHAHLHETLGSSHRLLQDVEGHFGQQCGGGIQDALSAFALNDKSNGDPAVKVVADVLKSEEPDHWTLARRAKDLFARWQARYGQAKARMLFMTHLVPILTASQESLAKAEPSTDTLYRELSGEEPPKFAQPVEFRGNRVVPGKMTFHDGHLQGKEFDLLGEDEHRYIVKDHENLGRPMGVPKHDEHRAFKVVSKPVIVKERHLTDASHHVTGSDPNLGVGIDFHPDALKQNKFATQGVHASKGKAPFFTQNSLGQRVFVKPDIGSQWAHAEGVPTAVREAAVKNVADFMGLGDHVPATSVVKHPKTGDMHSVQEVVKGGYHGEAKKEHQAIHEKLSALDFVTGNIDRHDLNYMHTDDHPNVKLIDNGYSFRYGEEVWHPEYAHKDHMKQDWSPATKSWINSIDTKGLAETMGKSGLNPNHIKAAIARLTYLKLMGATGKHISHDSLTRVTPEGAHPDADEAEKARHARRAAAQALVEHV